MTEKFSKLRLNREFLQKHQLPDIDYPVPKDYLFESIIGGAQIDFTYMLCGLQDYSASLSEKWQPLEEAMLRLAQIMAPDDDQPVITAESEHWFLEIGPVDLSGNLIVIQRGESLIAVVEPREDKTLRASLFHPPDAKLVRYLMGLAKRPGEDGMVCMRENNWEYALDQASHPIGAYYAEQRGESYLTRWKYGLAISADKERVEPWDSYNRATPIAPNIAIILIGNDYANSSESYF